MIAIADDFRTLASRHPLGTPPNGPEERLVGRNANYRIDTDSGSWFVKKFRFSDAPDSLARCLAYDEVLAAHPDAGLPRSPSCVVADPDLAVLVQEYVDGAESGTMLMVDQRFTPAVAATLGRTVARLHSLELPDLPVRDDRPTPAPAVGLLSGIPLRHVRHLTGGELAAYGLIQADAVLCDALRALASDSAAAAAAATTPIHGDLRADQVLVRGDDVWVVDWEEFGAGDPARDTGSFLGEWLYRAVLDIPTARGGGDALARGGSADAVLRRGREKARALAPISRAFWLAYRAERAVDDDFVRRTGAFAGWHLLDRLLAGAATNAVLPAIHRAAAGVGRSGVLNPAGVHALLGTEQPS
ncbi:class V lanthionine synthetase subunit LxmK [Rhodococcoides kroppenstedtii]|uniref:class V lanthionine synthetase subunit LxmK n=1 Tax=Rhodococcoides kroppenstedtii TaxID=293050 RepID=UPI001BDEA710|nr:class V lanthionine synthetase subunit LxmK [Rhodococcus kroppenstedtii]MBT1192995.1 aminoglycoside phosphotransferase family protein [Rhodococcus kroppenstedtii]